MLSYLTVPPSSVPRCDPYELFSEAVLPGRLQHASEPRLGVLAGPVCPRQGCTLHEKRSNSGVVRGEDNTLVAEAINGDGGGAGLAHRAGEAALS